MQEFGGQSNEEGEEDAETNEAQGQPDVDGAKNKSERLRKGAGTGKLEGRLITKERRKTGSVGWRGRCDFMRSWLVYSLAFVPSIRAIPEGWKGVHYRTTTHPVHGAMARRFGHEQLYSRVVGDKVRPPSNALVMYEELRRRHVASSTGRLPSTRFCMRSSALRKRYSHSACTYYAANQVTYQCLPGRSPAALESI